jgi:hypothetical protein
VKSGGRKSARNFPITSTSFRHRWGTAGAREFLASRIGTFDLFGAIADGAPFVGYCFLHAADAQAVQGRDAWRAHYDCRSVLPDRRLVLQPERLRLAADASTGTSRNMLRYKAIARVARFVDASEHLSTQTCSECGCVGGPKGLKGLEIREWTCDECGAVHDRDVNARVTFSVWDVRRLQKESPSTPLRLDREDVTGFVGSMASTVVEDSRLPPHALSSGKLMSAQTGSA